MHESIHLTDFATDAARHILDEGRAAIAERGLFRLALSGGDTPRVIHAAMARLAPDFPWGKVQITFGDERCVPPDDKDSNYRMAHESLLSAVPIPEGNIFRMRGEIDPAVAAREYEAKLAAVAARCGEPRYVHDLLLLGLGPDGHTASIFPGSPALDETTRNVLPVIGPKPPPQRLTMTFPLINAARSVVFLVKDAGKAQVVAEVQAADPRHPASRVTSATWLLGY
ncbi:MAG: 6-phosphogluconolactonase [Chthoniobacteraceae bacterium]